MPKDRPRILIVEAEEGDCLELCELITLYNYEVRHARSSTAALEMVAETEFDCAIISLDLADDGFKLSNDILGTQGHGDLPITFITATEVDEVLMMEAQFYGGLFVEQKPYSVCALLALLSSMVRIKLLQDELKARMSELDHLASTDTLTQLYNRRLFFQRLEEEQARASRSSRPLCLIYIDIDLFKQVNDTLGHQAGDTVLQQIARVMLRTLRKSDVIGRIGGEEFAVILPETRSEAGLRIGERLRQRVEQAAFIFEDARVDVTISLGMTFVDDPAAFAADDLVRLADEALLEAKRAGRNQLVYHGPGQPAKAKAD